LARAARGFAGTLAFPPEEEVRKADLKRAEVHDAYDIARAHFDDRQRKR
jgi:hypothetical protein